jgi:O-antigen ligase
VAIATTVYHSSEVPSRRLRWSLPAGWPLIALYLFFPLWWLLGLSHFVFIAVSMVMAWELLRRRPVYAPMAFGLWLLFLLVVAVGVGLLWVQPEGTVAVAGIGKLVPFTYRSLWYLSITVVALYILNLPEDELPTERIMRLLGWMFVYTLAGGIIGIYFSKIDFPSALELVVHVRKQGFFYSLIHPSIVSASDFLGYTSPRPTAPFAYANAWGNNFGLFLPFFIATWLRKGAGWRRPIGAVLLVVAIIPIAYSLNRGLWIGLCIAVVFISVRMAMLGNVRVLQITVAGLVVGAVIFVASPLYDLVTLRIATPHSNERRGTVATDVVSKTVGGSPLLGFGDTRAVTGSFASIAGGETPNCHQCAAPPLGTQGFMWRLIFTTGLAGTVFFLSFMGAQLFRFVGARDPVALTGCAVIVMCLVFNFVYDSLESPLFTVMIAIGLMNRRYVRPGQLAAASAVASTRRRDRRNAAHPPAAAPAAGEVQPGRTQSHPTTASVGQST